MDVVDTNTIWSEMDGEVILLDTTSGEFYSLNETASAVWQGLIAGDSLEQIAAMLSNKYGIEQMLAERDVADLIAELHEMKLLSQPTA